MHLTQSEQEALLTIAEGNVVPALEEVVDDEVTGDDIHVVRSWAGMALERGAAHQHGIREECQEVYDRSTEILYR